MQDQKYYKVGTAHKSSCVHTLVANYSPLIYHVSIIQSNKPGKISKNHVTVTRKLYLKISCSTTQHTKYCTTYKAGISY